MIKTYLSGIEFYNDNKEFLLTNPYTEVFFRLDAPLLVETNKKEYAIKIYNKEKILVALKKEPFNLMLFGDSELIKEMVDYLLTNNYSITDYLCPLELGQEMLKELESRDINYKLDIGMDFMECREKHAPSSDLVEIANESDVDEIYNDSIAFFKDCGLKDEVDKNHIASTISFYRVIRVNDEIASMARYYEASTNDIKISNVYTKNKYRGRGYAKLICNNLLNEIIDMGKYATLNVDQNNPVSYHIYSSIGFKKVFSQGVFVKIDN